MITHSREELKKAIEQDCARYRKQSQSKLFIKRIINHPDICFCKFLTYMRKETHYKYRGGYSTSYSTYTI